jgi:hypothetical protein
MERGLMAQTLFDEEAVLHAKVSRGTDEPAP